MKLPKFTARTPPPRETGLVHAQDIGALTRTGTAEFEAIAQLGGAIQKTAGIGFQAYMHRQELDDQATMGEISKRSQDADTEAIGTVAGFDPFIGDALPDDPKNYYDGTKLNRFDNPQKEEFINTTYKDYEAKILSLAKGIRNPNTRQAWVNSQLPSGYKNIQDAANAKHQEYQETLILGNAESAAQAGDIETSNKWIEIAEKLGLIGPKKAATERINNIKENIRGLYRSGLYDEARKVSDASDLSNKDKESMSTAIGVAERRAEKEQNKNDREKQSVLYAREDAGEILTRNDFEAAWLDPVEADQHFDEYERGKEAEARGEVNFVTKGDPIVIAKTEAIIDLNPMAITEEQLYNNATRGIGTENITGLVDRLRKAKEGLYTSVKKYDTQFATLLNAEYFGKKDEFETSTTYLEMKRKMKEFLDSQKPQEALADAFFAGLITKNFKGLRRGGWEEKGFKQTFVDAAGNEVTQRFRFGDIRSRKVDDNIVQEFYAGTDDDGDALWLPRR